MDCARVNLWSDAILVIMNKAPPDDDAESQEGVESVTSSSRQ